MKSYIITQAITKYARTTNKGLGVVRLLAKLNNHDEKENLYGLLVKSLLPCHLYPEYLEDLP